MAEIPTFLPVVAAAVRNPEGRWLLQQALPGKRHAGQWEFPGGKVEPGESPRVALAREVREELSLVLDVQPMQPLGFADEPGQATAPAIVLFLYACPVWSGSPIGLEGQAFGWFSRAEAEAIPLAAMDRLLLASLPA